MGGKIDTEPTELPTARELTRLLIEQMSGSDAATNAAATSARDACDCVSTEFSRWVGAKGYEALISRALADARSANAALERIQYASRPSPGLTGVAESIERHGVDATAGALATLLESILALSIRLIGGDIVATLVEKSMENGRREEAGRRHTLDQRSSRP